MNSLRQLGRTVMAVLRELGDENAYRRHLERHGRQHSREEWRRFHEQRLGCKYKRPRCC